MLNRIRVKFSHLRLHKHEHNFYAFKDSFCNCRTNAVENAKHYLLRCPNYVNHRKTLFDNLRNLEISLMPLKADRLLEVLLYGDTKFTNNVNKCILSYTVEYLCATERFSGSLFE